MLGRAVRPPWRSSLRWALQGRAPARAGAPLRHARLPARRRRPWRQRVRGWQAQESAAGRRIASNARRRIGALTGAGSFGTAVLASRTLRGDCAAKALNRHVALAGDLGICRRPYGSRACSVCANTAQQVLRPRRTAQRSRGDILIGLLADRLHIGIDAAPHVDLKCRLSAGLDLFIIFGEIDLAESRAPGTLRR